MSLEIHLQTNGVGTSECIEHTVCRIPVVAVAIVGVHDIGIVEEVVHVAEEGGIQVANLEAVAGIQVKLSSSRHLPGGGIGLVATVGSRDGEVDHPEDDGDEASTRKHHKKVNAFLATTEGDDVIDYENDDPEDEDLSDDSDADEDEDDDNSGDDYDYDDDYDDNEDDEDDDSLPDGIEGQLSQMDDEDLDDDEDEE